MLVKYPQNGSILLFHLNITESELAGLVISSMAERDLVRKTTLHTRAKLTITPSETLADVRIFNPFKWRLYKKMAIIYHILIKTVTKNTGFNNINSST